MMQEPWSVFPAVLDRYDDMLDYVLERARECGVPDKRLLRMQLGFEEAVVNVISYAYDKAAPGKVWLRAGQQGDRFMGARSPASTRSSGRRSPRTRD